MRLAEPSIYGTTVRFRLGPRRVAGPLPYNAAMRLAALLVVLSLGAPGAPADGQSPTGRWATVDDRSGAVRSIVHLRIEDGELRGTIEKLVTGPGEDPNPRCTRCTGPRRDQPVVGMQILGGLRRDGDRWSGGHVLDPENGKEYRVAVWVEGTDHLKVRGYWGFLYRTQTWRRIATH
jgi:uncharacterized protein (DUF2147 family)